MLIFYPISLYISFLCVNVSVSLWVCMCVCLFLPYCICLYFYFSLSLLLFISVSISLSVSFPYLCFFSLWGPCPLPFPSLPGSSPLFPSPISHMAGVLLVLASASAEHAGVVHVGIEFTADLLRPTEIFTHWSTLGSLPGTQSIRSASTGWAENPSERPDTSISRAHHSPADPSQKPGRNPPRRPGTGRRC